MCLSLKKAIHFHEMQIHEMHTCPSGIIIFIRIPLLQKDALKIKTEKCYKTMAELHIRGGIEGNSKIIFLISQ